MDKAEIERRVEEILRRDEPKFIKALELYYSHFRGDGSGMTFGSAAYLARVNPAYLVNYIHWCPTRIGMPGDREDALEYLKNLREYKESKDNK